ncbi:24920_t:CDS:2, partial [Gigaspora margarita]
MPRLFFNRYRDTAITFAELKNLEAFHGQSQLASDNVDLLSWFN